MDVFDKNIRFLSDAEQSPFSPSLIKDQSDLSLIYAPGLEHACVEISSVPNRILDLKIQKNTVAIVTDGSDINGLGNIGAQAALPVMEGKAWLFKEQADLNAFPICLNTQNADEIVHIVKEVVPLFSGISLGEMDRGHSFSVEASLQGLGVPVTHDLHHGLSIFLLAAVLNAVILAGKNLSDLKVVIYGDSATAVTLAELLLSVGQDQNLVQPVRELILCNASGIISKTQEGVDGNKIHQHIAQITNKNDTTGSLSDALVGADVFIDVQGADDIDEEMLQHMTEKPIVFGIDQHHAAHLFQSAQKSGAFIVGTAQSQYPNYVNDSLIFPGLIRGAIDAGAVNITNKMKTAAAFTLAQSVESLSVDQILPDVCDKKIAKRIASVVREAYVGVE